MLRSLPLLLTLLTGFSGLVYEVGWQRYLATLLGSHGEATAAVLGIFLGGLSAGYALFGRLSRRLVARAARRGERARLLLLYGLVEASIGLHALAFPVLFAGARELSYLAPGGHDALGFALDVLLTVLLIGPPTVLMGGTIPVLTQALPRDLGEASRVHAHVYGFNTAGAFLGALCAGFVLVPRLGLDGTVQTMGVINLFAGGVFLLLERGVRPESPLAEPVTSSEPGSATASGGIALAVVALLAGFAMMTVQVVLNRVGGLALGSSQFTFSMVVATFVLCIALGSFAVSALPRIPPLAIVGSQWALVATLALVYLGLPDTPYWAHMARTAFGSSEADFVRFHLLVFAAGLVALAVPIGLSGALLPLLFHHLRGKVADLGAVAGRLYAWNTVGSLLGALVGGYALLTWLDLHQVFRVALCALAVGSALLTLRVLRVRAAVALGLAGVAVLGTVVLPGWAPEQLSAGFFRLGARAALRRLLPAAHPAALHRARAGVGLRLSQPGLRHRPARRRPHRLGDRAQERLARRSGEPRDLHGWEVGQRPPRRLRDHVVGSPLAGAVRRGSEPVLRDRLRNGGHGR